MQCSPPGTYRGAIDVFTKIVRNEVGTCISFPWSIFYKSDFKGFRGLYKGATPPAVGWAAIDSVLLGSQTADI